MLEHCVRVSGLITEYVRGTAYKIFTCLIECDPDS